MQKVEIILLYTSKISSEINLRIDNCIFILALMNAFVSLASLYAHCRNRIPFAQFPDCLRAAEKQSGVF